MGNKSLDKVMFSAIQENDTEKVRQLLESDQKLANVPLCNGATSPLNRAVFNDCQAMVTMLLYKGADIDAKTKKMGRTPLMWASYRNNLDLVKLLLEKGADKDMEDDEGLNCFDIAVIRLQYEIAHFLYENHGMWRKEEERNILYVPEDKEDSLQI